MATLAQLRKQIKEQREVVWRKSCDIPTWGGRSFHVEYQQACAELDRLEKNYRRRLKHKRRERGGGDGKGASK